MTRTLLPVTTVLFLAASARAEVRSYEGTVQLRPRTGELSADLTVTVGTSSGPLARQALLLARGMRVEAFECDACLGYSFEPLRAGQFSYAPSGAPLTVTFRKPLEPHRTATFRIRYAGKLEAHPWGVNVLSEPWTELGVYSAWYPFEPEGAPFTYALEVSVEPAQAVTANADVTGTGATWRLRESEPTSDLVVITAPDLRVRAVEREGMRLVVAAQGVEEPAIEAFVASAAHVCETFGGWFGRPDLPRVTFALHRREAGGAYSRPRFVSMPLAGGRFAPGEQTWMPHEVAHFWWRGAPVTTWEDWLNESFAEYAAWMYLRETAGTAAFDARVERARMGTRGAPPVWGVERTSERAHDVLYLVGPLRLLELEGTIGRGRFLELLASLQRRRVSSTAELLDRVEREVSPGARVALEAALKR
jgi:hypothetical protein